MTENLNFAQGNELDGVAVLALSGYVFIINNDEETAFDSLFDTEL